LHAVGRRGAEPREHDEAVDHRDVARRRRRAAEIGERRRRGEVEHLRHGVDLRRDDEVVELRELPLLAVADGGIAAAGLADVAPGEIGIVELVELARGGGEDGHRLVGVAGVEIAAARRGQRLRIWRDARHRAVAVETRKHVLNELRALRLVGREIRLPVGEGDDVHGILNLSFPRKREPITKGR